VIGLGPFDLFAEIGRGGAGSVWSAVHRDQHQPVAVKFLSPQRASHPTFRAVFHNEVRAVAALNHPAIVRVFDYGEVTARVAAASEGRIALGSPYLIMELVRGGTLDDVAGTLHWGDLRAVLVSLLDALAHAHARGVIHRDIKPGNVLLAPRDEAHDGPRIAVKLTDFGLAHAFHAAGAPSERPAEGGTPAYMAPEQIQRRSYEFGPWTDLYAFGCVAWHLATGHAPFGASRARHGRASSKPLLPTFEPALPVPDGFESWMRTLMMSAPDQRFQCAADASHALLALAPPAAQALTFQVRPKADDDVTTLIATAFLTEVTGSVTEPIDDEPTYDVAPHIKPPPPPTQPPPFPEDWRRPEPRPMPLLDGAGLGLYGLRTVPFVGRDAERTKLWRLVSEMRSTRSSRIALVHGAPGVGKSRLAEWIARRASEIGAATVIRILHSPVDGPNLGIPGALHSMFRTYGMDRDDLLGRVEQRLRRMGVDELAEAEALTEWMHPSDDDPANAPRFATALERYLVLDRLFARLASRRPLIVLCDDVQWGLDTLLFVRSRLQGPDSHAPILLLLVATDGRESDRSLERGLLDELASHPHVTNLSLAPLEPPVRKALVSHLLPLDPELATAVELASEGNPQFAVQLLGDWVEQRALEAGGNGFRLRDGSHPQMPRTLEALWAGRVRRVLDQLSEAEGASFQVAATLGLVVTFDEWRLACAKAGTPASERAQALFLRQSLARSIDPIMEVGFVLANEMVRRTLVQAFPERMAIAHRGCAVALEELQEDPARIGAHWLAAGEPARAVGPLHDAAARRRALGDVEAANVALALSEQALRALDRAGGDARWFDQHLEVARAALELDDVVAARSALERAACHETPTNRTTLALERARLSRRRGLAAETRAILEGALRHPNDVRDEAMVRAALGQALAELGDRRGARHHLEAAGHLWDGLDDGRQSALVWGAAAAIALELGEREEASVLYERSLQHARRSGAHALIATASQALGDIARDSGRLLEAVRRYTVAHDLYARMGSPWVARVEAELAILRDDTGSLEKP
jgi:serine/threonine protein kinase/tetratricopeptide (TPR) repeat protein